MRNATPKTIYLKDYSPSDYLIDSVDLHFDLDEENCRVRSILTLYRNPASQAARPSLQLAGEELVLESIKLDEILLTNESYCLDDQSLTIPDVPERFSLEIVTRINPRANSALEGLYLSNGLFCTQCEAEGFRKITYFLDRPDIMVRFTTMLVASKKEYPVLLSNGNRIGSGEFEDGRHWVKWEDPFRKPCYLFALVAGKLACIEDKHTTPSNREIDLQIYIEPHDLDKCDHAMRSLKKAMTWDETVYGREYDLDLYMIVAVGHFNMGAMENKGLNIFNTKFVLARPDTATDADYEGIEGVIAHEYFHNWSGNRVTCRDWFQLSLKEGFTVFRDQMFSADQSSHSVKRIEEVNLLRTRQFAEDSGPMAHPIRPDSYIEINNFYTVTVYEKGAEVVRMLHTLIGADGFRKGSDLYFERHDGQAVTTDDFVKAMEDANGIALNQFRLWYSQAGTPHLVATEFYDDKSGQYSLTFEQNCPDTPDQSHKAPMHIPIAIGLLGQDGKELSFTLEGEQPTSPKTNHLLELTHKKQSFHFFTLSEKPVASILRNFSAPVRLDFKRPQEEIAFLFKHDRDDFNRWDAGQLLASTLILEQINSGNTDCITPLLDAFGAILEQSSSDQSYLALLLKLPSEAWLAEQMPVVDPIAIHSVRQQFKQKIAKAFEEAFVSLYQKNRDTHSTVCSSVAVGQRALKNCALEYLMALQKKEYQTLCFQQFSEAKNMTDQIASLSLLCQEAIPQRDEALSHFYHQWQDDPLVIDKWFSQQATSSLPNTFSIINTLMQHEAFDLKNPNRIRSLIGAFSMSNPLHFHALDGSGYKFLGDQIIAIDAINPQIASRLLGALTVWRRFDKKRQLFIKKELERIISTTDISKDVYEIASKSLK